VTGPGVRVTEHGAVLVVTIDRPRVRNAVDPAAGRAIHAALSTLDERSDLVVGVLTGAGGTFSAGKDIKATVGGEGEALVDGYGFAGLTRRHRRTPLIAAVEGYALGGGCELALACDLIVAAEDAWFGQPEVTLGLVAPEGGLLRLPRRVPAGVAAELLLTGGRLAAPRAYQLGLVCRLTRAGGALDGALALAAEIAANAPLAVRATTRVLRECAALPEADAFARQDAIVRPVFDSADAREGLAAFVERRPPRWRGE
jgi:enoyl-CoA hydratase